VRNYALFNGLLSNNVAEAGDGILRRRCRLPDAHAGAYAFLNFKKTNRKAAAGFIPENNVRGKEGQSGGLCLAREVKLYKPRLSGVLRTGCAPMAWMVREE
jgi:hypothetical protein